MTMTPEEKQFWTEQFNKLGRTEDKLYELANYIDWRDMEPDFREKLVAMIFDDFRTILNPSDR